MGDTKKKINGVDDSVWDGATRDYQESEKVENYGAQSDAMYDKTVNFKGSGDPQALYEQYKNYEEFSYDPNKDVLFQNAKASAMANGAVAMQDTVGMASTMTGGYGNSYAVTAGSQAYQDYLSSLDDDMATYYQLALDQYQQGKDDLLTQYQLASDLDNTAYQRQRDAYSMAHDRYNTERGFDYGVYSDDVNRDMNLAGMQNSDYWANANLEQDQNQFEAAQAQDQNQFEDKLEWDKEYASYSAGGGNASGGNTSDYFDNEAFNKKVEYYGNDMRYKISADGTKVEKSPEEYKSDVAKDIVSNLASGYDEDMAFTLIENYVGWPEFAKMYPEIYAELTGIDVSALPKKYTPSWQWGGSL